MLDRGVIDCAPKSLSSQVDEGRTTMIIRALGRPWFTGSA